MKQPKFRKPGKTRNPVARELRDPRFRQRTVRSPKLYSRKPKTREEDADRA